MDRRGGTTIYSGHASVCAPNSQRFVPATYSLLPLASGWSSRAMLLNMIALSSLLFVVTNSGTALGLPLEPQSLKYNPPRLSFILHDFPGSASNSAVAPSPLTQHNTGSTPVGSQGFGELEAGDPSPKVLVEDVSSSGGGPVRRGRRPRSRAPRPTIPIKCSHLGCEPLSFKRPCDLKLHMVRHSSPTGEFDCQTCGHRCKSKRRLHSHMVYSRKGCGDKLATPRIMLPCTYPGCNLTFGSTERARRADHELWHKPPSGEFDCEMCGKQFRRSHDLKLHRKKKTPCKRVTSPGVESGQDSNRDAMLQ